MSRASTFALWETLAALGWSSLLDDSVQLVPSWDKDSAQPHPPPISFMQHLGNYPGPEDMRRPPCSKHVAKVQVQAKRLSGSVPKYLLSLGSLMCFMGVLADHRKLKHALGPAKLGGKESRIWGSLPFHLWPVASRKRDLGEAVPTVSGGFYHILCSSPD